MKFECDRHCRDFGEDEVLRYPVAGIVVDTLLRAGLLRGTPRWGHTEMRELVLSESGARHLDDFREQLGLSYEVSAERWIGGRA